MTRYMMFSLLLLATMKMATSKPIVDPGLFVIMGVSTCRAGDGYCLLGADCTTDEDFLPDDENGHCDGLRNAFTPSAHFICCKYNAKNTTAKPIKDVHITSDKPTTLLVNKTEDLDLIIENNNEDLIIRDDKPDLVMTNELPVSKKDHVDIDAELSEVELKVNVGGGKVDTQDKIVDHKTDFLPVEKVRIATDSLKKEDVVKIGDNGGKDEAHNKEVFKKVGIIEKIQLPIKENENIDMAFKTTNGEIAKVPGVVVSEIAPIDKMNTHKVDAVFGDDVKNDGVVELPTDTEDDIHVNDWSPIVYTLQDDGDMKEIELDVKIPMESPGTIKLPGINKSTPVSIGTVVSTDIKLEQLNSIRRRLRRRTK